MPSPDSYTLPSSAYMCSTDENAVSTSVWLFPAAGLRIVVKLSSSFVAFRIPSRINPEVTFVRDDEISDGSSSFVRQCQCYLDAYPSDSLTFYVLS